MRKNYVEKHENIKDIYRVADKKTLFSISLFSISILVCSLKRDILKNLLWSAFRIDVDGFFFGVSTPR